MKNSTLIEISNQIKKVKMSYPFYGIILCGVNRRLSTKIDTLCVCAVDKKITLEVNEQFWNTLNDNTKKAVLMHEMLHIAFFHLTDSFNNVQFKHRKLMYIAADLCINQYIPEDYKDETWQGLEINDPIWSELGIQFKPRDSSVNYYKQLLSKANEQSLLDLGTLDDHSMWGDISEEEANIIKVSVKNLLMEAVKHSKFLGRGDIPGEMMELINSIEKERKPVINYKQFLRRFYSAHIMSNRKQSRKRPNVRFPHNPGSVIEIQNKVLVGIDTSGSVDNEQLADFFVELKHMLNSGAVIDVAQFDSKIHSISPLKKKDSIEIVGRGGTNFDPIYDHYINHPEYSCLIVLTDGEAPKPKQHTTRPSLWIISKQTKYSNNNLPGYVTHIHT